MTNIKPRCKPCRSGDGQKTKKGWDFSSDRVDFALVEAVDQGLGDPLHFREVRGITDVF
jgi:hypothetical protein